MIEANDAARRTPYELVFGDAVFEDTRFPAIAAEVEARGIDPAEPGEFVMLGSVGELLRALRPDGADGPTAADAVLHYGALVFQAFHFHDAGRPLFTLSEDMLERLIRLPSIGPWQLRAPAPAGYLQMPLNRLWVGPEGTGAAEPVDGFFWTVADGRRLDLVVCTGLRRDRPGLGAIEVAASFPAEAPGHWGDVDARETDDDFGNILPGGDIDSLHGLTNAAEVLKLASRAFWYMTERAVAAEPVRFTGAAEPHAMPPSTLPAVPVRPAAE